MKNLLRKLKIRLAGIFLPALIYRIVRLLYASMRMRVVGGETARCGGI
jgi:hypothetical protein